MASQFHCTAATGETVSTVIPNNQARVYCDAFRDSPEWRYAYKVYERDGAPFGARHRFTHASGDVVTIRIALPR